MDCRHAFLLLKLKIIVLSSLTLVMRHGCISWFCNLERSINYMDWRFSFTLLSLQWWLGSSLHPFPITGVAELSLDRIWTFLYQHCCRWIRNGEHSHTPANNSWPHFITNSCNFTDSKTIKPQLLCNHHESRRTASSTVMSTHHEQIETPTDSDCEITTADWLHCIQPNIRTNGIYMSRTHFLN